jgi:hypothetical protein
MMSENTDWPAVDEGAVPAAERAKITYEAKVADIGAGIKATRDAAFAREKAEGDTYDSWATANRNADIANLQKFHDSMYSVAVASIDRARAGADLVQKASAAVAALYTGVLALVFSVTDNPLPARGVLAPLFLGLAVVLSTAYSAYLGPTKGLTPGPQPVLGLEPKSFQRLNTLIRISSSIATRRSSFLRASVVALGVGLAFIVLPFISFGSAPQATQPTSSAPAWPTPDVSIPVDLNKILYDAQVKEAAQARATKPAETRENDVPVLIIGLLLGGIAVAAVPRLFKADD